MPKNTATKISVDRQLKWYAQHKRRNPNRVGILIEGDSWFTTPVLSWEGPTLVARLKPELTARRIPTAVHRPLVKLLVDEFNRLLGDLARSQQRFHYLDLRGLLDDPADWADEIHPHSDTGIKKLRDAFVAAIHAIHAGGAPSLLGGGRIDEEYRCG